MLQLRRFETLSGGDHHWLKTRHHFAVDPNGDPAHRPLGSLIVWNDDEVAPRTGFPMHPHRDMEIITYVREGLVRHQDTTGAQGVITAGNVQAFSAGTGIRHAEYNPGDAPLKIFQIWLRPRHRGNTPHWANKTFPKLDRAGQLVPLASGFPGDQDAVPINADARVLGATLKPGQRIDYLLSPNRYAYLVPARGSLEVNGLFVRPRDGVAISEETVISIEAKDQAEIVLVDAA